MPYSLLTYRYRLKDSTSGKHLAYKAKRLGVTYREVNESWSSVTCTDCLVRSGPRGLRALGVRVWSCVACGAVRDRDLSAARNIIRLGRETLSGIPRL